MNRDSNLTDSQLATLLKGSDEEKNRGLKCMFLDKRLERSVFSKILGMGGSMEEAQNVYQDGFLLFNRHVRRGTFREESSPSTFFVSICINHWKDSKRRVWDKRVTSVDNPIPFDRADDGGKESSLEQTEIRQLARKALDLVSGDCEKILLMQSEGMRNREIADGLGIQESSVKNKIFRCRERLREKLDAMPGFKNLIKNILQWL